MEELGGSIVKLRCKMFLLSCLVLLVCVLLCLGDFYHVQIAGILTCGKGVGDAWYALVEKSQTCQPHIQSSLAGYLLKFEVKVRAKCRSVSDKDTVLRATVNSVRTRKKGDRKEKMNSKGVDAQDRQ